MVTLHSGFILVARYIGYAWVLRINRPSVHADDDDGTGAHTWIAQGSQPSYAGAHTHLVR